MSMGRQEAYEIFKRDYSGNHEIEDQKKFLKKSYAEAKMLGELINTTRNKLNNLKAKSEQIYARLEVTNDPKLNAEYESIRNSMESEKEDYRANFEKLKHLKTQIEHAQHMIEKSQVKLQKDFENWWTEQCEIIEQKRQQENEYEKSRQRSISIQSVSTVTSSPNSLNSSRVNSSLNTTLNQSSYHENIENSNKLPQLDFDSLGISNPKNNSSSNLNFTGNSVIDADIAAFINARKRIINQMKPNLSNN